MKKLEKSCINCGTLRSGYDEEEICECPDKSDCIEELRACLEKAEKALRYMQLLKSDIAINYFAEKERLK